MQCLLLFCNEANPREVRVGVDDYCCCFSLTECSVRSRGVGVTVRVSEKRGKMDRYRHPGDVVAHCSCKHRSPNPNVGYKGWKHVDSWVCSSCCVVRGTSRERAEETYDVSSADHVRRESLKESDRHYCVSADLFRYLVEQKAV